MNSLWLERYVLSSLEWNGEGVMDDDESDDDDGDVGDELSDVK